MSASSFSVQMVDSANGVRFIEPHATFVKFTSRDGDVGVYAGHTPSLIDCADGEIELVTSNQTQAFFVQGGLAMIDTDSIVLVADCVESVTDIDVDRAQSSQDRAAKRLNESASTTPPLGGLTLDAFRANRALNRAEMRLSLVKKYRSQ